MQKNITAEKMLSHIDRIVGAKKPITADIFITNYCNNKCPYCTYGRWGLDSGAYAMKYKEFVTYAEKLLDVGVQGIILTGGGEPTINPEFEKIADWLSVNKIHWGMNTNFNKFTKVKPDYLKVSFDAYSEESYERMRGVQSYTKVRENIESYAKWKLKNSSETSLGIQQLVKDHRDARLFYENNKDLPVDYIVFRPVESTAGKYYTIEDNHDEAERIKKTVMEIAETDERVNLNFKWDLLDKQEESCTASWAQIALNERGEVMYCCHKPYQILGHILDEDIMEKKAKAITDMRTCDIPCRMTAPNMEVKRLKQARKDACFI